MFAKRALGVVRIVFLCFTVASDTRTPPGRLTHARTSFDDIEPLDFATALAVAKATARETRDANQALAAASLATAVLAAATAALATAALASAALAPRCAAVQRRQLR